MAPFSNSHYRSRVMIRAEKLLAEGTGPLVERQAECQQSGLAQQSTFEAVAKELAEGDAPTALQKKQWLLDFANKEFGKRPAPGR